MREITAKQAARAAGGRVIFGDPEKKICHISLDSRKMEGRDLFVPIVGERVDAHRFICQATVSYTHLRWLPKQPHPALSLLCGT